MDGASIGSNAAKSRANRYRQGPHIRRHANGRWYAHWGKLRTSLRTYDQAEGESRFQVWCAERGAGDRGAAQEDVLIAPPPLPEFLDGFLGFLYREKQQNRDAENVKSRAISICKWMSREGLTISDVDLPVVRRHLSSLGRARGTQNRYLTCWITMLRWAKEKRFIAEIPIQRKDLVHRREGNRAKDLAVPTSEEVKAVLEATQPGYRSGFAVMASTGLRYQELMLLGAEDVQDVSERQTTRRILIRPKVVRPGEHRNLPCGGRWMPKGAEQRTIEVQANVLAAAKEWVEWKTKINSRAFWFRAWEACQCCGTTTRPHMGRGLCARCYKRLDYHARRGTLDAAQKAIWEAPRRSADLSVKGMNGALARACEAAGVPVFTMKVFRDFRITTLDQEGWSLEDIRRYIGHASIRTTEGYVKPTRGRPLPTSVLDL